MGARHTYVYSVRTQFENIGDLIINATSIALLSKDATVHCLLKGVPGYYERSLFEAVDQFGDLGNVKMYRESLLTFILLWPIRFGSKVKAFYVQKPGHYAGVHGARSLILHVAHALLMLWIKINGGKVIRMPSSVQRRDGLFGVVTAFHSRLCNKIFVRDLGSLKTLQRWRCSCVLAPDMAHYAYTPPKRVKREHPVVGDAVVAISPRNAAGALKFWSELIDTLCADGRGAPRLRLVSQVFFDTDLCQSLNESSFAEISILDETNFTYQDALVHYIDVHYVISDRLHALLFGRLAGASPILSASSSEKLVGYFDTWFHLDERLDSLGPGPGPDLGREFYISSPKMVELRGRINEIITEVHFIK